MQKAEVSTWDQDCEGQGRLTMGDEGRMKRRTTPQRTVRHPVSLEATSVKESQL